MTHKGGQNDGRSGQTACHERLRDLLLRSHERAAMLIATYLRRDTVTCDIRDRLERSVVTERRNRKTREEGFSWYLHGTMLQAAAQSLCWMRDET